MGHARLPVQGITATLLVILLCLGRLSYGEAAEDEPTVRLDFAESVRLVDLIQYVSERTQTRFIYDDGLSGEVHMRSPVDVQVSSLLPILRSVLEFKGYQITEQDGWYKVQRGGRAEVARQEGPGELILPGAVPAELSPNSVYTLLLKLRHVDVGEFTAILNAAAGLSPTKVPESNTLVFTDYGARIAVVLEFAELLDQPRAALAVGSHSFQHVQASQVKDMALGLLRAQGFRDLREGGAQVTGPMLFLDQATNRMILVAPQDRIERGLSVLKDLDAPGQAEVRTYEVRNTEPARAATFIKEAVRAKAPGLKEITIHEAGTGRLLVIAPPAAHEAVSEALRLLEDCSSLEVRYHTVKHVQASRIEALARTLLGVSDTGSAGGEMLMVASDENTLIARLTPEKQQRLEEIVTRFDTPQEAVRSTRTQFYQIRNTDAAELAQRLRSVLGLAGAEEVAVAPAGDSDDLRRSQYLGIRTAGELTPGRAEETAKAVPAGEEGPGIRKGTGESALRPEGIPVRIVADENTNTIIVQAPIEYHRTIAQLIDYLDRRRPQVLIEATIAMVSADSDLSLAVELLHNDETGAIHALVFSAFGLSTVDVSTGTRELISGPGLNASVVDRDGTSAILRALRSDGKSRVIAEPKLLINDNATGSFESVQEEPFTSVNMGETVSTTTFAGYAEAGLTIRVTPRISEGDFVTLDYAITSRDFVESSSEGGVPPARTSDVISSSVTVTDGHAVIVGGLYRRRGSKAEDKVPILGSIPILGNLFRSRTRSTSGSRLFVFLRPVILRDEDFSDLKELSRADLLDSTKRTWGEEGIYPPVKPRVIE